MNEVFETKTVICSCLNELLTFTNQYGDKEFYFRGENRDNGENACLPSFARDKGHPDKIKIRENDHEWFQIKLEALGVGFPYTPPDGDKDGASIINVFANLSSYALEWRLGGEKIEALKTHYSPEFWALKDVLPKADSELSCASFFPQYLDVTSDIMVALHFACSEFRFYKKENEKPVKQNDGADGFLFLFDKQKIERSEIVKLVSYPGYSYFCKRGEKIRHQPFDRITHQRGAFLAPQRDKEGSLDYAVLAKEIRETCLYKRVVIKNKVKRELYEIFGKEKGLEYYHPKIPCTFANEVQEAYKDLQGITLF